MRRALLRYQPKAGKLRKTQNSFFLRALGGSNHFLVFVFTFNSVNLRFLPLLLHILREAAHRQVALLHALYRFQLMCQCGDILAPVAHRDDLEAIVV